MSGPHFEDELYGMTGDEMDRLVAGFVRHNPPPRGLHHEPPLRMPPSDEVERTLDAHRDFDGDGYCDECGEMTPCGTRYFHESQQRDRHTP